MTNHQLAQNHKPVHHINKTKPSGEEQTTKPRSSPCVQLTLRPSDNQLFEKTVQSHLPLLIAMHKHLHLQLTTTPARHFSNQPPKPKPTNSMSTSNKYLVQETHRT